MKYIPLILLVALSVSLAEAQVSRLDRRFNKSSSRTTSSRKATTSSSTSKTKTTSTYVTLDGLYNEESIQLPTWFWEEVKDINEQLKEKLSPSDYLEILKGEKELYGGFKTKNEYLRSSKVANGEIGDEYKELSKLKIKLQNILDNPEDDTIFPRPHFLNDKKQGVFFREYLRFTHDNFGQADYIDETASNEETSHLHFFGDEENIVTQRLAKANGRALLYTFWNSRTGRVRKQFLSPTWNYGQDMIAQKSPYGNIYFLRFTSSESAGYHWFGSYHGSYLIAPLGNKYQSFWYNYTDQSLPPSGQLAKAVGNVPYDYYGDGLPPHPWFYSDNAGVKHFAIHSKREIENHVSNHGNTFYFSNDLIDGYSLNWDSLTLQHVSAPDEKQKRDKIEEDISNALNPAPIDWRGDPIEGLTILDTHSEETLFVLGATGDASDPPSALLGLHTKNGVYLFPGKNMGKLKPEGKIRKYEECISQNKRLTYNEEEGPLGEYEFYGTALTPHTLKVHHTENAAEIELEIGLADLSGWGGELSIIRLNTIDHSYRTVKSWKYSVSNVLPPIWIPEKKWFLKPENDYQYSIIEAKDGTEDKKVADLFVDPEQGYAIVLPDGRYSGSPGCENFLAYGDGEKVIGIKALAPWKNRPADILEVIGGNQDDITALKETTKRWLKKQGFDIENMPAEPTINELPKAEVHMPDLFNKTSEARFTVKLRATAHDISKVEIRVDGVLVPQSWDAQLKVSAGEEKDITVEVPLANGQNWIEVTPVDNTGIMGDTERFRTIYKGSYPSDLFIVALGVSNYDDPDLKLEYAAKDAQDIAQAFEKYGTGRKHMLVLTDKEVKDRNVLKRVQDFLSATSVEDRVVFYVAGHGMLDDKLNYYYAPAGFNAENIMETGIPMEELTACLHTTKARHRLLLLDTCHSGVLGEEGEDKLAASGVALPHGVRAVQTRGMKVKKIQTPLNTNQKKRYIEDLFSYGNTERGINIIAGAAGAEYALESSSWNNGVFTASVIQSLNGSGTTRDLDRDGFFSVEEILKSIVHSVYTQTGGRQRPNVVASEGSENMILVEGVGFVSLKKKIEAQDWEGVEELLSRGMRAYDNESASNLMESAINKQAPVDTLRKLLNHGWTQDGKYYYAMHLALDSSFYQGSKEEIANMFFEKGIKQDTFTTHTLCESPSLIKLLLENGVNPNTTIGLYQNNPELKEWQDYLSQIKKTDFINNLSPLYYLSYRFCNTQNDKQREEYLEKIHLLLMHGADPNIYEGYSPHTPKSSTRSTLTTPLYVLCRSSRLSFREVFPAVKLLIQYGADIHLTDCNGKEPLDSWDPNYKILVRLSEAAKAGQNLEDVQVEIADTGAPAAYVPMQTASDRSALAPMIQQISAMSSSDATMQLYRKRLLTLLPLIQNGADVNTTLQETKGNTALHYACGMGYYDLVRWLVEHGANVNQRTNAGKTPMDCIGGAEGARIRQYLKSPGSTSYPAVQSNSYSQATSTGLSSMISTIRTMVCRDDTSKLYQKRLLTLLPLIENGADVNTTLQETKGNTALHYACGMGYYDLVQWLVTHGANVNQFTNAGKTPLDCVGSGDAKRIRELLISQGARNSR